MNCLAIPIVNGALPRPDGGVLQGVFLDPYFAKMLVLAGIGGHIFLFPVSSESEKFYPVGILVRIEDIWQDKLSLVDDKKYLFAKVIGRERLKARAFQMTDKGLIALGLQKLDLADLRYKGYPAISGAGWYPTGGYTTFSVDRKDVEITIYGFDLETGQDVVISAYLDDLIEAEIAHTVEHGIIRSLKNYSLCTPKTLRECMKRESEELKWSVEIGIANELPEVFGVTKSGICGNPLTQMASYYMSEEFKKRINSGEDLLGSIKSARSKTLSMITRDMDINTQKGKRALQGLKKGMFHDDTPKELTILSKVIKKFPQDPWH